jgi:hypothetical protein
MRQVFIPIPDVALEQLTLLAEQEYRSPKEQATVLILEGLKRRHDALIEPEQVDDPRTAR